MLSFLENFRRDIYTLWEILVFDVSYKASPLSDAYTTNYFIRASSEKDCDHFIVGSSNTAKEAIQV